MLAEYYETDFYVKFLKKKVEIPNNFLALLAETENDKQKISRISTICDNNTTKMWYKEYEQVFYNSWL